MRCLKLTLLSSKIMFALALLLTLFSCDRIKRKGDDVVDKAKQAASGTKQKISDKTTHLIEKAFPTYDSYKADTENNKKRFKEHLQVDLTSDVKDIYTYGDFLGVDYKILIAFTCNKTTINKITEAKKMQLTTAKNDDGLLFLDEFGWWDKNKIEMLKPYEMGKEQEYWQYLWYDATTGQAFYEEFSL